MIREFVSSAAAAGRRLRVLAALTFVTMAAALAGPALAQQKPRPAQADPAKPALVQQFGDWGAFATPQSKARTCYALSQPKQRAPGNLKRDPAFVFVTHRPAEKVRNEIAIIMGFEVKPDSKPVAAIGGAEFELVAKGEHLWLRNAADEGRFIGALRKGPRLIIKAHSLRNNLTTDTYSLSGVAQALDRAMKECP
jgi:invasion protein IalB